MLRDVLYVGMGGDALLDNVPGKIRIGTQNELVDAASGKVDTVYLPQEGSAF